MTSTVDDDGDGDDDDEVVKRFYICLTTRNRDTVTHDHDNVNDGVDPGMSIQDGHDIGFESSHV